MCPKLSRGHFPLTPPLDRRVRHSDDALLLRGRLHFVTLDCAKRVSMSQELTVQVPGEKKWCQDARTPTSSRVHAAVVAYDLALVDISLKCPRTHFLFTLCPRIPRTESRDTSARSTCTAGSRARLPGVRFRVVRTQEPSVARELAEGFMLN
jgi:hypothetical protein